MSEIYDPPHGRTVINRGPAPTWPRDEPGADTVYHWTHSRCRGCGRDLGYLAAAYAFDDGATEPPEPAWPFAQDDCPVCSLRTGRPDGGKLMGELDHVERLLAEAVGRTSDARVAEAYRRLHDAMKPAASTG